MIVRLTAAPLAALAALTVSIADARAQQAAATCKVETDKPGQLKTAKNAMARAIAGIGDPMKSATDAIKELDKNGAKIRGQNDVGYNMILGQAYTWLLARPGQSAVVRRGDIGFTTDAAAPLDLLVAADSAFDIVERASPECVSETEGYRRPAWEPLANSAAELINNDQLDSAETLIKRADILYQGSPHTSYFTAIIAQKRNDLPGAIAANKRTLDMISAEAAAKDEGTGQIRNQVMYNYALLLSTKADADTGAAQKASAKAAADAFKAFIDAYPGDEQRTSAQARMGRMLAVLGDTAAVAIVFSEMLADPSKYTEVQLLESGTNAFNASRFDAAAKLFEAVLERNPYYRDALFNLANTYWSQQAWDKMLPVAKRLAEVDPNNQDVWQLLAIAYKGRGDIAKAAKNLALERAMYDTAVKNVERKNAINSRVAFTHFTHDGPKHTLRGTIENASTRPATYTVKFEFLDNQGTPVVAKEVTVGPVEPKKSAPFAVEVNQTGIVAFRYTPF
ncbi:MAG: tetratricopeptide repeat protein [Gemmatimonadaceae bacterium]